LLIVFYVFSSTKLEKQRAEQVLLGEVEWQWWEVEGDKKRIGRG
jgi:hypothetical protein